MISDDAIDLVRDLARDLIFDRGKDILTDNLELEDGFNYLLEEAGPFFILLE